MKIDFKKIDHIQICIPIGQEEKGRAFYCEILGLEEIPKPSSLSGTGFWVSIADMQIHIGTEELSGESKRHPAFEVVDVASVKQYLTGKGVRIREERLIPGVERFSLFDPWDNRMELLEKS